MRPGRSRFGLIGRSPGLRLTPGLIGSALLARPAQALACACASNTQGDRALLLVGAFFLLPLLLVTLVVLAIRRAAAPGRFMAERAATARDQSPEYSSSSCRVLPSSTSTLPTPAQ